MALPPHFAAKGWVSFSAPMRPRVMIGTDGDTNSGKTEFILSAPGPGVLIPVDRNFEGVKLNSKPPSTRRNDWAIRPISIPLAGQETIQGFQSYWRSFYTELMGICQDPVVRAVGLDGDSDSWELQRLAEFGRTIQVPEHLYGAVNAARRAMIARMHDSGKIVIATNKVKAKYVPAVDEHGEPVLDKTGEQKRMKSEDMERQGFRDQRYLWQIQLRHLFKPASEVKLKDRTIKVPMQWGILIQSCKPNMELVGQELWGEDCNFKSLVTLVYPNIDPESWYK